MPTSDHDLPSAPFDVPSSHLTEPVVPELIREDLVTEALPWLDEVARTICWQLNNRVPLDDLRSLGHFALTDLVRRHDPSIAPFEPYMRLHLRWAMLDGVRRQRHTRAINARAKALMASAQMSANHTAPPSSGMPPSEGTFGARLRVVMRDHAAAMGISLLSTYGAEFATAPSSGTPERAMFKNARHEELRAAVAAIRDKTMRELVDRHYFKGRSLAQVADELRISKSWASRLHAQAIELLADKLRGTEADPASSGHYEKK